MNVRTMIRTLSLLSALTATSGVFGIAHAQDNSAQLRAARLTSSQGTVSVSDGTNPAVPAQMNVPLPAGVQIATGDDGQAEIEFEDGSVARLTPNSALSLDRLDIAPGQLFVTDLSLLRGLAYFELRATQEYVYSINAGGDVVSPVENATIRVNFDEPPASFAVLDGAAEVQRADTFQAEVRAGETLRDDATSPARYSLSEQIAEDSWDQWNADMDDQEAQQASDSTSVRDNYAGAQGYGWGDLDADGTWYNVPGQGEVWQPYAAEDDSDFDPYGNGAWVSYPGTGYVWASAYPWGWTPYRCGAWSYYNSFGWGWAPGATCGGFGWGFAGGGFLVNIRVGPRGYRPVHVPVGRPGPVHPVIPVRVVGNRGQKFDHVMPPAERRPRQIGGVTAQPIAHSGVVAGRAYANASLGRDFPIDRTTHRASMGIASTRPTNVYRVGQRQQSQQQSQQTQRLGQQTEQGQQQNRGPGTQNGQAQQGQQQGQSQQQQGERRGFQGGRNPGEQGSASQNGAQQQQNSQPVYTRPQQNQSGTPGQQANQPIFPRQPQQNAPQQGNSQPVYTRPQQNQSGAPGQQGNQPTFPRQPQQNAPQPGNSQPGYMRPPQNSQQQPNPTTQQGNPPSSQPTFTRPQGQQNNQQSGQPQHTAPEHPMDNRAPSQPPQQNAQPMSARPQENIPQQRNSQPIYTRPQQQNVPPPSAQPQHTAPEHPNFTPAPARSHPSYSPPEPHYSAPPPPAPHMSAPASPPPAPHVSAPPPSPPPSSSNSSPHR
jgi:hypothetical protein